MYWLLFAGWFIIWLAAFLWNISNLNQWQFCIIYADLKWCIATVVKVDHKWTSFHLEKMLELFFVFFEQMFFKLQN